MECPTINSINPFAQCGDINVNNQPYSIREDFVYRGEDKIGKVISNEFNKSEGHVQFVHISENRFLNGTIGHLYYKVNNNE